MIEKWKDIPTWNGLYKVSNYGRLKKVYKTHEKILTCYKNKTGYYTIVLQHKDRREIWFLHRLVAITWFRDLQNNEVVHHKNKITICNCINNLQIKEKSEHSFDHNTGKKHSQQTKRKQSLALKGRTPWNKGKKASLELIQKRIEGKRKNRSNKHE